jgi:hypothetical protein
VTSDAPAGSGTAEWLAEVLHVVLAVADGEHLNRPGRPAVLTHWHAEAALAAVPADVLDAAGVRRAVAGT